MGIHEEDLVLLPFTFPEVDPIIKCIESFLIFTCQVGHIQGPTYPTVFWIQFCASGSLHCPQCKGSSQQSWSGSGVRGRTESVTSWDEGEWQKHCELLEYTVEPI